MIGQNIKEIRLEKNKTQMEVSKETGIPQNTISWIEKEKGIANIEQCIKLANYYQVCLDELVGRDFREQTQKNKN